MDVWFKDEYGKLFENIEHGQCKKYEFENEYGKVSYVYIKREIPRLIDNTIYYDVVTPYGYGGPLILESSNTDALMQAFAYAWKEKCTREKIVSEFVRFHLYDNIDVRDRFYGEASWIFDNVAVRTNQSEKEIWQSFESKVRKNVRRARESGLVCIQDENGERLDEYLEIYNETMERNNAADYYFFGRDFFESIHHALPGNFCYFHILKNDIIISTELILCSDRYAYSYLGGTLPDYFEFRPNDLLKYHIINWCRKTGREFFVLGGGAHKDDGIYRYKKSFAPQGAVPFYVGRVVHNQSIYDQLVDIMSQESGFDKQLEYFPLYRQ